MFYFSIKYLKHNFVLFCFISQAYVNIIAGGCMVIGLKYAGSANKEAFECLVSLSFIFQRKHPLVIYLI